MFKWFRSNAMQMNYVFYVKECWNKIELEEMQKWINRRWRALEMSKLMFFILNFTCAWDIIFKALLEASFNE